MKAYISMVLLMASPVTASEAAPAATHTASEPVASAQREAVAAELLDLLNYDRNLDTMLTALAPATGASLLGVLGASPEGKALLEELDKVDGGQPSSQRSSMKNFAPPSRYGRLPSRLRWLGNMRPASRWTN